MSTAVVVVAFVTQVFSALLSCGLPADDYRVVQLTSAGRYPLRTDPARWVAKSRVVGAAALAAGALVVPDFVDDAPTATVFWLLFAVVQPLDTALFLSWSAATDALLVFLSVAVVLALPLFHFGLRIAGAPEAYAHAMAFATVVASLPWVFGVLSTFVQSRAERLLARIAAAASLALSTAGLPLLLLLRPDVGPASAVVAASGFQMLQCACFLSVRDTAAVSAAAEEFMNP